MPKVLIVRHPPGLFGRNHYLMHALARVLGRRGVDISKRRISRQLVHRTDSRRGPVIIKTDANYVGIVERLAAGLLPLLRRRSDPGRMDAPGAGSSGRPVGRL